MNFHALADLFPLMQGQEFEDLVADIRTNGLQEPIWTYEGQILDGRNRWRACEAAGVTPAWREYEGDDPVGFVVSLNLHRRHLDDDQRRMVGAKIVTLSQGRPGKTSHIANISREDAVRLVNADIAGVDRARKVISKGADELVSAVQSGLVSVNAAADLATLPKEQQTEIVAKGEKEILEAAKKIRADKAQKRREENAKLIAEAPPPPEGKYRCIVIDPPWQMQKIERDVAPNQVAFEYPTMSEEELAAIDFGSLAADDGCHFFCWTTHKHLPMALRLLDAWGYQYVCTMVWHKNGGFQPFGLPQYNCEFVLYARKNSPEFVDLKDFMCCFNAPRREHSRKPDEFYDVIRRVTASPRIDIFAREPRDGFDVWGNEAGKFAA